MTINILKPLAKPHSHHGNVRFTGVISKTVLFRKMSLDGTSVTLRQNMTREFFFLNVCIH